MSGSMHRARVGALVLLQRLQIQMLQKYRAVSRHCTIRSRVLGVMVLCLLAGSLIMWSWDVFEGDYVSSLSRPRDYVALNPTLEEVGEAEFVWQIPQKAKAVLLLAHGCRCKATYFWDQHVNCTTCVGFPEERRLVLEALRRHYAVIAISSQGNCWKDGDKEYVKDVLKSWIQREGLEGLPVTALGASSGGHFVSSLALEVEFRSLVIMIASGIFHSSQPIKPTYPPTLFVHMPKDAAMAARVSSSIRLLTKAGVLTKEVKCFPLPLTPSFFAENIPGLSARMSSRLFRALKDSGLLNRKNFLRLDGRYSHWQAVATQRKVLPTVPPKGRLKFEFQVQEELNRAYGEHEITSQESKAIFDWLDDPISALAATTKTSHQTGVQSNI